MGVGLYGQRIEARGYGADFFDNWEDDDPADHEVVLPVLELDFSNDPDWLDEVIGYINVPDDEFVNLPGQLVGIRVDALYAD